MITKPVARLAASSLNPLIGVSAKDTTSLVSQAMRHLAQSDGIHPQVAAYMADLAAAALEYEEALAS